MAKDTQRFKPELEEKLKRLRKSRMRMIGRRPKYMETLPKFWDTWHKAH